MIERKSIQAREVELGQFFTPVDVCRQIVSAIDFRPDDTIIEPSFGSGNFFAALATVKARKIGIEIDGRLANSFNAGHGEEIRCGSFFDFSIKTHGRLVFIGNPPYRTPAPSLRTHRKIIETLAHRYGVLGIREEAVFFLLHSIDLILSNRVEGEIHYILPEVIFKNNSKFFTRFKWFLLETCTFRNIVTIPHTLFAGVSQSLVSISLHIDDKQKNMWDDLPLFGDDLCRKGEDALEVPMNEMKVSIKDWLCLDANDEISYRQIFKRTYLGSVPCESLLMSVQNEPLEHFMDRLCSIVSDPALDESSLYARLQYNGNFHLKLFSLPRTHDTVCKKLSVILSYVKNIRRHENIIDDFKTKENYKEITVRNGQTRFYFRCAVLKKNANFVYELNPCPGPSFYFTGNPSHSSTDYFGFCNYDINRNVSPGANRTVPLSNLENNLTDFFKSWWRANTDEPFENIFDYIIYVSKTAWYKEKKRRNKRFYFSIPKSFIPLDARHRPE